MSNPDTIQIEITDDVVKIARHVYKRGDIVSFEPADAKAITSNGWGKAVKSEKGYETGERIPGPRKIIPKKISTSA